MSGYGRELIHNRIRNRTYRVGQYVIVNPRLLQPKGDHIYCPFCLEEMNAEEIHIFDYHDCLRVNRRAVLQAGVEIPGP